MRITRYHSQRVQFSSCVFLRLLIASYRNQPELIHIKKEFPERECSVVCRISGKLENWGEAAGRISAKIIPMSQFGEDTVAMR